MKRQHFHKYERMSWPSGKPYLKCVDCPHYLPVVELAIGRESLCWGPNCNKLVSITKEDIQKGLKHFVCDTCREERFENREALKNI